MAKMSFKKVFILSVAVISAIFFNKYTFKAGLNYPKSFINFESYLFNKAENIGGWVDKIRNFNSLASEDDKLKQDRETALSLKAKIDSLESENDFLRSAARMTQRLNRPVVDAGIFNINLGPAGYNALLNKGVQDEISEGDVVVTPEGILVGRVQKVMQNFSRILLVSDADFKVTSKIIDSNTSGIARGALSEGMYLDFVVQEDEIKEGDVLVSTGNDGFPPALVVGSVEHIETNPAKMFKNVRVHPAVKGVKLGKVLVIKMKQ